MKPVLTKQGIEALAKAAAREAAAQLRQALPGYNHNLEVRVVNGEVLVSFRVPASALEARQ